MSNVFYVTGGARSGKSSFALQLAGRYEKKIFLATAEPFDDEMKSRIRKHKEERLLRILRVLHHCSPL